MGWTRGENEEARMAKSDKLVPQQANKITYPIFVIMLNTDGLPVWRSKYKPDEINALNILRFFASFISLDQSKLIWESLASLLGTVSCMPLCISCNWTN